jgi:uncharacterized protein (TIGR00290 family)
MTKVIVSWSGGKDSAMALYAIRASGTYEVLALLTTVTEGYDRISMHGVRRSLLEEQSRSLNIPAEKIYISQKSSNEEYEARLKEKLLLYLRQGVSSVVIGDIFLEDLRKYREENLAKIGMKGIFPLWKRDTAGLAREFIDVGFKAVITCVDSRHLPREFAGREFDRQFLSDLPASVDPCGENGEFHSFVYDGPVLGHPVLHRKGEIVLRDNRFYYCDLLPSRESRQGRHDATSKTPLKEKV